MPSASDALRAYHVRTKHHLHRYAPGPHGLDWAQQPDPFRVYAGAERLPLPLRADRLDVPFDDVRAGRAPARPLDRDHLALLFELSLGLSAWKALGGTRWALRCNPSSGNLHPTEGYLVCPALPDLAGGVYHYVSRDHAWERRARPEPGHWSKAWPASGCLLALSSISWREAWKYGERAYRYCQHDAGHALAALRYAAAALGWPLRLLSGWGDEALAALLGLSRPEDCVDAEAEVPELVMWLGADPPPAPAALLDALRDARWHGRANRLSASHRHWPAIGDAERAVRQTDGANEPAWSPPARPPLPVPARSLPAAQLFRQRRSAVAFDGVTAMPREAFFTLLDAVLPRAGTPPLDALPWSPRIHFALFVHRVTDLAPGLYCLPRRPEAEPALRDAMRPDWLWAPVAACPAHLSLRLLLPLDLRAAARTLSCHQDIAADSAFSLAMLAEFDAGLAQGAHWYRRLFWEAGAVGQALYLEAEAAGLRATGIGCYFDDEVHRLLGLQDTRFQSLYHFTVGGPLEDGRLTTLSPYAHLQDRRED